MITTEVRNLRRYAKRWGGDILFVSEKEYDRLFETDEDFYEAPFTPHRLGVHWNNKQVITVDAVWPEIVHEMGHVFACNDTPYRASEYEFFGWEYLLAGKVGDVTAWIKNNSDYRVVYEEQDIDFGSLSPCAQRTLLKECVVTAHDKGLAKRNAPRAIR